MCVTVCICVCVCISMCICANVCVSVCVHVFACVCVHMWSYTLCVHMCMCALYIDVCMRVCGPGLVAVRMGIVCEMWSGLDVFLPVPPLSTKEWNYFRCLVIVVGSCGRVPDRSHCVVFVKWRLNTHPDLGNHSWPLWWVCLYGVRVVYRVHGGNHCMNECDKKMNDFRKKWKCSLLQISVLAIFYRKIWKGFTPFCVNVMFDLWICRCTALWMGKYSSL